MARNAQTPPSQVNAGTGTPNAATLPCCKDSVIVEFRPTLQYKGEFGFDWLRVFEGHFPSNQLNHEDELSYIDAADGRPGRVEGGAGRPGTGTASPPPDLSPREAKEHIKKEYLQVPIERTSVPLRNRPAHARQHARWVPYRWLTYYVPYLNLFPEGTAPAWEGHRTLNGARKRAAASGRSHYCLVPPPGTRLPRPPCEATLQVVIDVKLQAPHKIVLEYNPQYLEIAGATTPGKYDLPQSPRITLENSYESVKSFGNVTIKCIKAIPADTEITAWACDSQGEKVIATPVGKMIVRANDAAHQKRMKIALVRVKTNIMQSHGNDKNGTFTPDELTNLYNTLHQALIIPDVINTLVARDGSKLDITLDLTQDAKFHVSTATALAAARATTPPPGTPPGTYIHLSGGANRAPCINPRDNGFAVHLETNLDKGYPALSKSYYLVFSFAEGGPAWLNGMASGHTVNGAYTFRSSCSMYPGRDDPTLAHELLHTLQLFHTHRDPPDILLLVPAKKYIFPRGETTNIMSYNHTAMYSTWRWQWEIMQKNADKIAR